MLLQLIFLDIYDTSELYPAIYDVCSTCRSLTFSAVLANRPQRLVPNHFQSGLLNLIYVFSWSNILIYFIFLVINL